MPFSFSKNDFAVWSWLILTIWIIKCPVIVKVKFRGMCILSCHLSKELRKATKNHKAENKICSWNCMGYWVSSDVNDKLRRVCK